RAFLFGTRPEMAFIIERIGLVDCVESREFLKTWVSPWNNCPSGLTYVAAYSAMRLDLECAVPLVAVCFGRSYPYYHRKILGLLRGASREFREALANHGINGLASPPGTQDHLEGVTMLAYLADERLINHLRARMNEKGELHGYEYHALLAVGSDAAGA